ncbi:MAG TPA: hypothetical protein PLK37_03240 [Terricaulis sp.]|nr:hypothetical protein [Terricaulis sp.]
MVQLALVILIAAVALLVLAFAIGAREPVFAISGRGDGAWFVALKRARPGVLDLAPGVKATWMARADFGFIGGDDAYWSDFMILVGGGASKPPLNLGADIEDAFIARLHIMRPPALALGVLKLLVKAGVLSRPNGQTIRDASALGHDTAHLPSNDAIAALLTRPQSYAPAMVNFLHYHGREGAAAYRRYGRVAMRTVYRTGGHLLFYGRIAEVLRPAAGGPCMGHWDDIAAMRYNRPEGVLSMEHAPDYRAVLKHRDEGLARTVVIASNPGGAS